MEKVIVALWAPADLDKNQGADDLRRALPEALTAAGASRIRLNLRDSHVEPAAGHIQQWQSPQQDAVAQFWLPTANPHFLSPVLTALAQHCARFAAWLVSESTILPNTAFPASPQNRTPGWSQATFLTFRSDIPRQQALDTWLGHHTRVAIDTQANFEYIQNLIVRPLTADAPAYDGFVEECFPEPAMTQPAAFYDAVGDEVKFQANLATMIDSCGRFIDFNRIDVIPTSQYDC